MWLIVAPTQSQHGSYLFKYWPDGASIVLLYELFNVTELVIKCSYSQTPGWQHAGFDELTRITRFSQLADIRYTWSLPSLFIWQVGPRQLRLERKKKSPQSEWILLFVCLGPCSLSFTADSLTHMTELWSNASIQGNKPPWHAIDSLTGLPLSFYLLGSLFPLFRHYPPNQT